MSFGSTDDTSAFVVAAVLRRAAPEGSRCSPRSRAAARRNDLDADQRPVTILSEEGPASYHSASNLLPASNYRCRTQILVPSTVTRASAALSIVLLSPRQSAVLLAIGLVVLLAANAWKVWAIIGARYRAVRAVEALAAVVPLFLLLFAAAYYPMARASPVSFSQYLTRTDALYFTITIFSTVGFGDITAVSESARLVVVCQMILDLLILGLGIRVVVGAVHLGRQRSQPATGPGTSPEQPEQQNQSAP